MVRCSNCSRDVRSEREHATGSICCSECGRVIYQDEFQDEPTFVKGAGGESRVSGNYVRSIQSDYPRSLENGKMQINDLMVKLEISDGSLGDKANQDIQNSGRSSTPESITAPATEKLRELCEEKVQGDENAPVFSDESDNLFDIDDIEVNSYLDNEKEKSFRKIIWEELYKEYIQKQAAKAVANGDIGDVSNDVLDARKFAAAALAERRKLQRERDLASKNAGPAKTPAQATLWILTKKGLRSRINCDVLDKLYDEIPVRSAKRSRT